MQEKYLIGEFSEITGISKRMLRHYDKLGLFTPAEINDENNYRYYLEEQIVELEKIQFLRSLGFTLTSVSDILSRPIALTEFLDMLKNQEVALAKESKALKINLMTTQRLITLLEKQAPQIFPSINKLLDWERSLAMTVNQEVSLVDLKSLMNRDLLFEKIEEILEEDKNDIYYFITFDIDMFMSVNDIDGFDVGDRVIQNVISIIVSNLKPLVELSVSENLISRLGGDECSVFLKNVEHEQVIMHVESVLDDVKNFNFKSIGCSNDITISCGISYGPKPYNKGVLRDGSMKALLEAKRNGRNQYRIHQF